MEPIYGPIGRKGLRRAILTCSGRCRPVLFLLSFLCFKVNCTEYICRWLSFFLFQSFCNSDLICSLLNGSRPVCGIAETSGSWAKALFAVWSAFLFPIMPMWLGSQQRITSFLTSTRDTEGLFATREFHQGLTPWTPTGSQHTINLDLISTSLFIPAFNLLEPKNI